MTYELKQNMEPETLFQSLYTAIAAAAEFEVTADRYLKQHTTLNDTLSKQIDDLKTVILPERMGMLISVLDLYTSFQMLGRYIRSFADAAFVIHNLEERIIAQLNVAGLTACEPIDRLVA